MDRIFCGDEHEIAFSYVRTPGSRHREKKMPCEDVVWIRKSREWLFCGLADGKSGARYGAEGGRLCLEAISDYIDSAGIRNMLDHPFPDELPCTIIKAYRERLLQTAQKKSADFKEFASTLLAIAVDLNTGKYMLMHLGDGSTIRITERGDATVVSTPDNGLTSCHTWLTTSAYAVSHLRVSFGTLRHGERLMMLSDGATCFCRNSEIPSRAKNLLKQGSQSEICRYLLAGALSDDAACIVLDCRGRNLSEK